VLGCYGHRPRARPTRSPSPALDQLAREGVRMVDPYAPSSWTLPSHLSMLTGQPPLVHGVETEAGTLDASSRTMAEILKEHGSTRGHLLRAVSRAALGLRAGFDSYQAVYGPTRSPRRRGPRARRRSRPRRPGRQRTDELKLAGGRHRGSSRSSETAVTSDQVTGRGDLRRSRRSPPRRAPYTAWYESKPRPKAPVRLEIRARR